MDKWILCLSRYLWSGPSAIHLSRFECNTQTQQWCSVAVASLLLDVIPSQYGTGDCTPSRYVTSQLGQLSLASLQFIGNLLLSLRVKEFWQVADKWPLAKCGACTPNNRRPHHASRDTALAQLAAMQWDLLPSQRTGCEAVPGPWEGEGAIAPPPVFFSVL